MVQLLTLSARAGLFGLAQPAIAYPHAPDMPCGGTHGRRTAGVRLRRPSGLRAHEERRWRAREEAALRARTGTCKVARPVKQGHKETQAG